MKPGGWEDYKRLSNEIAEEADMIIEDKTLSNETVMKRFDKLQSKVKYKAFGKTKFTTKAANKRKLELRLKAAAGLNEDDAVKAVMRKQYDEMEEQINNLKAAKYGRATNIFKMREKVAGSRKSPQEVHAVKDIATGENLVSIEKIKEVTLEHCLNTFRNNEPEKDVKLLADCPVPM